MRKLILLTIISIMPLHSFCEDSDLLKCCYKYIELRRFVFDSDISIYERDHFVNHIQKEIDYMERLLSRSELKKSKEY